MDIVLYNCTCDKRYVDKSEYFEGDYTVSGTMRDDVNVCYPVINIFLEDSAEYPFNYNYAYIEALDRYYFIDNVKYVANNLWEISMSVDVLMSYQLGIKNLEVFVNRNEHTYNVLIPDDKVVMELGETLTDVTVQPQTRLFLGSGLTIGNRPAFYVLDVYCGYGV